MNGPKVIFTIPLFGGIKVTESIVNMWIIMAVLVIASIWLTHGLKVRNPSRKQLALEKVVTMLYGLVRDNMGAEYMSFTPYIGTL
ncbi:MAG: F0F1 ATP synthase subunit A, partial [Clostridia bacterium]|nr:F0F1 ATP synthase subunit A [Clostridia bacterium]